MSSHYKVSDDQLPHFVTSTIVGWVDALTRDAYKDIICESLVFCQKEKGMQLHAWVIMSNHIHLIVSAQSGYIISNIMRDFKKFTSKKIVRAIALNNQESRKGWMLNMFRFSGQTNASNEVDQFWQSDYHPVALDTEEKMRQKLNYLHENPVRAGIVWEAQQYRYSSAIDYYEQKAGLLQLVMLL